MSTPALVGIAALAGAIAGGKVGVDKMRDAENWLRAIYQSDVQCLASGLPLPRVEAPPVKLRLPRNGILVFLVGPLIGLVVGFVAVAVFVQLLASMAPDATGATRVLGAIFWGFFGAAGGGFMGIFLGLLFYFLEVAARATAFNTALRRDAWGQREQLRVELESGRTAPAQAIMALEYAIAH